MHVQVDVDRAPARNPATDLGLAARVVTPRGRAPIDLLDLVGHRLPVAHRAACLALQFALQCGAGEQALELAGERDRVTRLKQQADLAIARELAVERQLRRNRDRLGRERGTNQAGCLTRAPGRGDEDVSARDQLLRRAFTLADDADTVAQPLGDTDLGRVGHPDGHLPCLDRLEPADRPQEQPQRALLLVQAERDPNRRRGAAELAVESRRPPRVDSGVGPRSDALVAAGKEALDQGLGRSRTRRPRIEASEEDLDERPGDLGRKCALARLVEAADVERT